jgi:sentrin-specific protease 7
MILLSRRQQTSGYRKSPVQMSSKEAKLSLEPPSRKILDSQSTKSKTPPSTTYSLRRETRAFKDSDGRNEPVSSLDLRSSPVPQSVDKGPRWAADLIYPPRPEAKNKAVVHYDDLDRLAEDEMLNDNLLQFYIRWLQDQRISQAKQAYIFQSHFYSSLGNGRRGINYKAVEKWTRKDDIFTYDFVMVPICEAAHWFLALVCNLPNLTRQLVDDDVDMIDIDSQPTSSFNHASEVIAMEPASNLNMAAYGMLQHTTGQSAIDSDKPPALTIDLENETENPSNDDGAKGSRTDPLRLDEDASTSKPRGNNGARGRPKRVIKRKLDPHKPIIIILDSMGMPRAEAIRNLKDYLVAEAYNKRGTRVSKEDIKAVNFKRGLPQQNNYIDCGLYVCGYVEKFLENPTTFGRKLFEDEFDLELDWPNMNASKMRQNMLRLLKDLAKEQEETRTKLKSQKKGTKAASKLTDDDQADTPPNETVMDQSGKPSNTVLEPLTKGQAVKSSSQRQSPEPETQSPAVAEKVQSPPSERRVAIPGSQQNPALPNEMTDLTEFGSEVAESTKKQNSSETEQASNVQSSISVSFRRPQKRFGSQEGGTSADTSYRIAIDGNESHGSQIPETPGAYEESGSPVNLVPVPVLPGNDPASTSGLEDSMSK